MSGHPLYAWAYLSHGTGDPFKMQFLILQLYL